MAPAAPPPYTSEQISAMKSPEERARALAVLTSYIKRMKSETANGQEAQHLPSPGRTAPARGGFGRGGKLRGSYHPYRRPARPQESFGHRSVVFNSAASTAEPSDTNGRASESAYGSDKPDAKEGSKPGEKVSRLCPAFTNTGACDRPRCYHVHDPAKLAVCKGWLYKDHCNTGDFCILPHTFSAHTAPTCIHFSGGTCTNDECRFAHIRINPAARNCEAFGRLGYCEKGATCTELHAHKCPDFANTGSCTFGDRCRLGHGISAPRMKVAGRPSSHPLSGPPSPTGSQEQLDEAELAQDIMSSLNQAPSDEPHLFTQQVDFVPLDHYD